MPRHLSFPFRFVNGALATVEQDSPDEITECVAVLAQTPVGFFTHDPTLGIPDPLFTQLPVQTGDLDEAVAEHEDRVARLEYTDDVDDAQIALGRDRVGANVILAEED